MILQSTNLSNRDRAMLNRAAGIANASTARHKHGALIYRGGRVLSVGINTNRNVHPTMEIDYDSYSEHAEVAAIRGLGRPLVWNANGATLYVARINSAGHLMLSKPCRACEGVLRSWGIKRVVFSTKES